MVDVKGRWALITGASRGIGIGVAVFMAERGCNLILQGRKAENCEETLKEVKALGVEAYTVGAELSKPEEVQRMLDEIDRLIRRNSIFIDLQETREFNPYLIEAAAYGLQVYTTSDLYEDYKYPNICNVNYNIVNAIGDFDYPFDSERKVRLEIISNKRLMEVEALVSLIQQNYTEESINKNELMKINEKNSWTSVFAEINKNIIFENK